MTLETFNNDEGFDFDSNEHHKDNHRHDKDYDFGFEEREELFEKDETHDSRLIVNLRKKYPR